MAEAKRSVSFREFRGWCEYVAREPSVGDRLDWWMGQLLAVVLNYLRKPGASRVKAEELIPDRWGDRKPAGRRFGGRELGEMLKAWARGG